MNTSGPLAGSVRKLAVWTTTAALAASLAACSGQPEQSASPETTTPGTAAPGSTTSAPAQGNVASRSAGDGAETTGGSNTVRPTSSGTAGQTSGTVGDPSSSEPQATPSADPSRGTDAQAPSQPQAAADTSAASGAGPSGPPLRNSDSNARFVTVDNPSSLSIVVNKQRPLYPLDYKPSGLAVPQVSRAISGEGALLRDDAGQALAEMFNAAAAEGINLTMLSGYRSFGTQVATYNNWVVRLGSVAEADSVSARPGYSEHQTGLAVDIGLASGVCSFKYCFNNLPAASWMEKNAHKYGYIVRYELGYHDVTGFYAEPWHLRYIGVDNAKAMHSKGIHTLEKFFGLPAAPSY